MSLFASIAHPLGIWAYLAIAVLVMVEGPIATLVGAVAASAGYLHPGFVFLAAASGNLTSDTLWYLLGYLGDIEWVMQFGRWAGLRKQQVVRLQVEIQKHVLKILFIAKLTMGFIIPVLIATGLSRVPFRRWFGILFLGECIWTGTLVILGYNFGRYIRTFERGVQIFALVGAISFAAFTIRYVARHRARAENKESESQSEPAGSSAYTDKH